MKHFYPIIFSILVFLYCLPLFSIEKRVFEKSDNKLTLKEAVRKAVEHNPEIRNNAYELVKSDSGFLKSQSKYSWRLLGGIDSQKSKLPDNQINFFSGTKTSTDKFNVAVEKIFQTGTYFKIDASSQRFDSNAFEDPIRNAGGGFSALAIPALYTGAIALTLSQDLLKNSFGVQDQNIQEILKNQGQINRLDMSMKISNTIVDTLVSYWSYIIATSSVNTFEQLITNSKSIRDLTVQKTKLGLAENFEVNQWNALLSQTQNQLEKSKLEQSEAKRKLKRILNLTDSTELGEISDLEEDIPVDLNLEKDIELAFKNRYDWKSLLLRKDIAARNKENAKDDALPSVKLSGSRSAKGQTLISPQYNYLNTDNGIPTLKYYDATANLKISYPLFDKGVKVGIRDAEILSYQVSLQEEELKKEIIDDLLNKHDQVVVGHKILKNAIETRKQSANYYKGLYNSFRQGRFTAVAVKNALDTLVQNELQETQSKINFNINILRYELAKNQLFEKYDIDIDEIIPKF
jgi:outer membrane protein TolC